MNSLISIASWTATKVGERKLGIQTIKEATGNNSTLFPTKSEPTTDILKIIDL